MNKKDTPADEHSQVAADFGSLWNASATRISPEPTAPEMAQTKVITVEELEQIIADHQQAWNIHNETKQGAEPEFPTLSGVFDPRGLVEAARNSEPEFPWLPSILENTGNGLWKYNGFVVFDRAKPVTQSGSVAQHNGSIVICHKGLGEVVLTFSNGRLVDLEILALLF